MAFFCFFGIKMLNLFMPKELAIATIILFIFLTLNRVFGIIGKDEEEDHSEQIIDLLDSYAESYPSVEIMITTR